MDATKRDLTPGLVAPLFDSHFHIINYEFPLVSNNAYIPDQFTCADYLKRMASWDLCGGVIVSGSFQAFDQDYLLDALQRLGPSFVGVTQLPASVTDVEILRLHHAGVRAVRFNLKRGGSADVGSLSVMAARVYEVAGWHVELYIDSAGIAELYSRILELPSVSIDHLGLDKAGLPLLVKLAEKGVRVKASGFGRADFNVSHALRELNAANPGALMFGSDLPSTRAPRPFSDKDVLLIVEALGTDKAEKVLSGNALELYKLSGASQSG
ncbi:2-pyrone-4,6-dicarboxylate hydrolase [Kineobactrum sediminis]|uniref:2-pyrone-4,6-dicarboxylate hydrolase n=1 Tax=Kineobactrum sediminis TaxID=1905677 RepID=A0A2N5Y637_9GAMM|nr:amidohydrolase family protein [Kineobactrum sediminis]PLW83841.1 2-pyrone-4,6-dicarboxylate hydrolase [Kineobactrum sediminis]